jgi:poly(3-hydroxybutyrate) depolymerase
LASTLAAPFVLRAAFARAALSTGDSSQFFDVKGVQLNVLVHVPDTPVERLLIVFHGSGRDADTARRDAMPLGAAGRCLIVAPYFDEARFPEAKYQNGGIGVDPVGKRTIDLVEPLAEAICAAHGASLPYYLIGHSAGGQFVQKVAAFEPGKAKVIVAANPGVQLVPRDDENYPYGYGKLRSRGGTEAGLQRYLAAPLVFYQGTADTRREKGLAMHATADRQGLTRYERGLKCFAYGRQLAEANGWPFKWKIYEVPSVGHSSKGMYAHRNAVNALFGG